MQASTLKRTPVNQFIGLALVLALLASIALGVAAFNRSGDDVAQPSTVHLESIGPAEGLFFEARMARIEELRSQADASAAPAVSSGYSDMEFGQVMVEQYQARQRAAQAARERFLKAKFDQMATGH
jgi:hypothetical protein